MTTEAVILAAGRGSRMGYVTETIPKSFININGKRLIDYQIEKLKAVGIDKIYIVTGYMAEKFKEYESDVELVHNSQWEETNMIWSFICAAEKLKDEAIVLYSDIIYDESVLYRILNSDYDNCIIADKDWLKQWALRFTNVLDDAEGLQFDEYGKLISIGRKVKQVHEIMAQFCGILKLDCEFVNLLKAQDEKYLKVADFTMTLDHLISLGFEMYVELINGGWFEVDTETDVDVLKKNYLSFLNFDKT